MKENGGVNSHVEHKQMKKATKFDFSDFVKAEGW